jgi:NADPH-dependent 2,4-dienoyl-CoA reductase/sulfur reductase-like enzyme
MKFVIIGGDAAGMSAASQAKRIDKQAEVIVLEMTEDVSYGACGLPYKLPPNTRMEDLQIISAERFRDERGIDVRLAHRVTEIAPKDKVVRGQGPDGPFEERYDALLIASGAHVFLPPIEGLSALLGHGAYPLKTLQDGRTIKAALEAKPPKSAVVIGAGYIGLEATENLSEMGVDVTVIEAVDRLLPFLPEPLAERVEKEAAEHGVTLELGTFVRKLEKDADGQITVTTSNGSQKCDLVLVATGVKPTAELASAAGIELAAGGSIKVDEYLRTSVEGIYAAGDCADATHAVSGESVWYPLALRANRAGKLAGENVFKQGASASSSKADSLKAAPGVMGTAVFKFFGLEIARTGLSQKEAAAAGYETVEADILASTRAHYYGGGGKLSVWLLAEKKSGRLLGGAMVGPEAAAHKIDTVVAALYGEMTAAQLYDMDLAYAPPFGPSWSPLLTCASMLSKKVGK